MRPSAHVRPFVSLPAPASWTDRSRPNPPRHPAHNLTRPRYKNRNIFTSHRIHSYLTRESGSIPLFIERNAVVYGCAKFINNSELFSIKRRAARPRFACQIPHILNKSKSFMCGVPRNTRCEQFRVPRRVYC